MKARIHASHIGIQGCLRRAREVLYWPGMNRDIENCIAQCHVYNSQPREQTKEPMICHEIPTRPWEKIAVDLFQLNGRDYMVTVDYYSSFFEVDSLTTKTAVEVIRKLKAHLQSWTKAAETLLKETCFDHSQYNNVSDRIFLYCKYMY